MIDRREAAMQAFADHWPNDLTESLGDIEGRDYIPAFYEAMDAAIAAMTAAEPTIDDVLLAAAAIDARLPGLSDAFPDDPDDDLPLILAHLALSAARKVGQP